MMTHPVIGSRWRSTDGVRAMVMAAGITATGVAWVQLSSDPPGVTREWPLGPDWQAEE